MEFACTGPVIEWRGPAPFYFLELSQETSDDIKEAARGLEYWGQVAVVARIAGTEFRTALFPKDGHYLLPLRVDVRREAGVEHGQEIEVDIDLAPRGR
ncbi:MAG TPA: DUF1905 domain-containing protein [Marmoricola sp.]